MIPDNFELIQLEKIEKLLENGCQIDAACNLHSDLVSLRGHRGRNFHPTEMFLSVLKSSEPADYAGNSNFSD